MIIKQMHLSPYDHGNIFNKEPKRDRKLLMHKREINRLYGVVKQDGLSLIPLSIYFVKGRAKVLIGVCRGKKNYDKRESIKERDVKREIEKQYKYGVKIL